MNLSRDLGILLVLMGVGFVLGWFVSELADGFNPERSAIAAAVSSAVGMALGYGYLACEKRQEQPKRVPKRPAVFSPQVVGETCTHCAKRVIFVGEAFFCADCGKPYHRRCGKPPRCSDCEARVAVANLALIPEWEYDAEKMEWVLATSEQTWTPRSDTKTASASHGGGS